MSASQESADRIITVYGASDDLIEIEGDLCGEFPAAADGNVLAFSDGTALRIAYTDNGIWRITPVTASDRVQIIQAPENDEDNYSDTATLRGPIEWVVLGSEIAVFTKETHRD